MKKANDITIHPTAVVDPGALIGTGTKIWHFSHICAGARIGARVNIGQNVYIASTAVIGDGVKIQNNVSVYDGVIVEDYAFLGPSAVFTNVNTPRSEFPRKDRYEQTLVRRGATIGANAVIVCGTTLGAYSFVASGAVVTKDVADFALVMGVPAGPVGWVCMCGERINFDDGSRTACGVCARTYTKDGDAVRADKGA